MNIIYDKIVVGLVDVFKPEVQNLEIISTAKASEGNKRFYKIVFRKVNDDKAIVYVSFDLSTFVMKIEG